MSRIFAHSVTQSLVCVSKLCTCHIHLIYINYYYYFTLYNNYYNNYYYQYEL